MMPPLQVLLFLILPDAFLLAYVGTRLLKIPATTKQLIWIAFWGALFNYIIRSKWIFGVIVPYMIHTLVIILGLAIIVKLVLKVRIDAALVAIGLSMMLVILGDQIILSRVMEWTGKVPLFDLPKHPWKWILLGWSTDGFLAILAIFIRLTGYAVFPMTGEKLRD